MSVTFDMTSFWFPQPHTGRCTLPSESPMQSIRTCLLSQLSSWAPFFLSSRPNVVGGEILWDLSTALEVTKGVRSRWQRVYARHDKRTVTLLLRTADYIFERKGVYRLYDLKTIQGKASVDNRLKESIGQSNRILLNMAVDYNPRHLAMSIKRYFEQNHSALEVLIFKGSKIISIIREDTESYVFIRNFMMKY